MADFGFLSNTDESAVDELISQAQDLYILEQISAINCSSFTNSELSADLESRFRRLKSLPDPANPNSSSNSQISKIEAPRQSKIELRKPDAFSPPKQRGKANSTKGKSEEIEIPPNSQRISSIKGLKGKNKHGSASSSSDSSDSGAKEEALSKPKSNSWLSSLSPFQKCSSEMVPEKKVKETKVLASALDWEKSDEFLSDLKSLPVKDQQKILRKTLEEQRKLRKEASQMVKVAKKGSSRTTFYGCEDELSDS